MTTKSHLESFYFEYKQVLVVFVDDVEGDVIGKRIESLWNDLIRRVAWLNLPASPETEIC